MILFKRLARDSSRLLLARTGAQACMVITAYLLARRLGAAGFGEYAFISAVILIGNVLTTFGSDMYLIREIAAKGDYSDLPPALILQLTLSGLFIGMVFLLAPHLPKQTSASVTALKVYSLALIPLAFFTVFTSVLRGAQKMTSYAWLNFALPFAQMAAVLIFIPRGAGIVTLAWLLLVVQTLGAALGGVWCVAAVPETMRRLPFAWKNLQAVFSACVPIASLSILGILYQKMSLLMLSLLASASAAGTFSAAARVAEAARIGHVAVFTALYPALAAAKPDASSDKAFKFAWLTLHAFSVCAAVLIFLLAQPLVEFFFGAEYRPSIPALKILAFALIPYTTNSFLSLTFLAGRGEKIILRISLAAVLLTLALNFWLIPEFEAVGAAWTLFISEMVQAVLFLQARAKTTVLQSDTSKGASYELPNLP
ncbi:MAG: oligosaccharide flippase family protein [Chloroflexota bacterium]|jgi:PST family polysaccharide transporter